MGNEKEEDKKVEGKKKSVVAQMQEQLAAKGFTPSSPDTNPPKPGNPDASKLKDPKFDPRFIGKKLPEPPQKSAEIVHAKRPKMAGRKAGTKLTFEFQKPPGMEVGEMSADEYNRIKPRGRSK